MSLSLILAGLGHLTSGLAIGILIPTIVVLIANLLILGLLFALGVAGVAWFVHGLMHEAALYLWRRLLPDSYADDVAFEDGTRRLIMAAGAGIGLLTTLIVAGS